MRPPTLRAAAVALVLLLAGAGAPAAETPEQLRDEAFEAAQWAMTSEAAEALAQVSARFAQGDDDLGRLADERERLVAERDMLERQAGRLAEADGEDGPRRRAEARRRYEAILARLSQLDAEIDARFPAYGELTSPRPLPLARAQALLQPDEGLLLVLTNEGASYVWALTRERAAWARAADLGEAEMGAAVARLRAALTAEAARGNPYLPPDELAGLGPGEFDRAAAWRLYDALVRPVEGVFEGKRTLITVTGGDLAALPLAVLLTEPPTAEPGADLADLPWLVDRYALAALPAVSSLEALRCHLAAPERRAAACPPPPAGARPAAPSPGERLPLVGFGAPVLDGAPVATVRGAPPAASVFTGARADVDKLRRLPDLPGSRAELAALAAQFPGGVVRVGEAATETAVRGADRDLLARARYVVFSTHGLLADAEGVTTLAEPGLVLTPPAAPDEADDGYLSASEAAGLSLSADIVVLSACNTAAPDGRPGAGGLSGLARSFFYAGARSVMVSHWAVSDRATTALVTGAFAGLESPDIGRRAEALRQAMREVRATPGWGHPAYWAAFTLVGEPG